MTWMQLAEFDIIFQEIEDSGKKLTPNQSKTKGNKDSGLVDLHDATDFYLQLLKDKTRNAFKQQSIIKNQLYLKDQIKGIAGTTIVKMSELIKM